MKSHSAAHAVNKNLQFCNEPFSCSCCNQYLMFWSNKMKSYSAAIAVNNNSQFMQYTLSALLSSFPWTTQKSIIVENSKIVENFGATIFSIMEFDCNMLCFKEPQWFYLLIWDVYSPTYSHQQPKPVLSDGEEDWVVVEDGPQTQTLGSLNEAVSPLGSTGSTPTESGQSTPNHPPPNNHQVNWHFFAAISVPTI